jgi:cell division protease FtsH
MEHQSDYDGHQSRRTFHARLAVPALLAAAVVVVMLWQPWPRVPQRGLGELAAETKLGQVRSIQQSGDRAFVITSAGERYVTLLGHDDLLDALGHLGVTADDLASIDTLEEDSSSGGVNWLSVELSVVFGAMLLLFFLARWRGPNAEVLSFVKSPARRFVRYSGAKKFDDVAGMQDAKQEVQELVEFLRRPWKFAAVGAELPRGILLSGPPGTGKTLLARAVAGEAGVPFFSISGSEFVEMVVGVGASRVRDLFQHARRNAPCIVFVDEIDAIGKHRVGNSVETNQEREQTLNQILVEMDGFTHDTHVIVMAATNRADVLDQALLRPGRFDRKVVIAPPQRRERLEILEVHARTKQLAADVDLATVAALTDGFTGADLANVMNEAAILGVRHARTAIGMAEIEEAIERQLAGPERKTHVLGAQERTLNAYHQAAHVVVMHFLPAHDPVHKVSIVLRGSTLGAARSRPTEERHRVSLSELMARLSAALAGHVAEELVFGEVSTSSEDDIETATSIARQIVQTRRMLAAGERLDDGDIRCLMVAARATARDILVEHRDIYERVAHKLLEQDSLQGDELDKLLNGVVSLAPA